MQESFVLPSAFGITWAARFLPAQHEPLSFALDCDHLALESFIEETKPIFSSLRRRDGLHVYNVQPSVAESQGDVVLTGKSTE
jgi:hypothetical protein